MFPVTTRTTGTLITATIWNADIVDNMNALGLSGSWTPVIGGSGGTSGQAYSVQVGRYRKLNRLMVAWFTVTLSTKGTITGNVQIQGLTGFTSTNTTNFNGTGFVTTWSSLATSFVEITLQVNPNTTAATILGSTAASAAHSAALVTADLNNNSSFIGVIIYETAT